MSTISLENLKNYFTPKGGANFIYVPQPNGEFFRYELIHGKWYFMGGGNPLVEPTSNINTLYVNQKYGDDKNNGTIFTSPKKTINSALRLGEFLNPTSINRINTVIMDSSVYAENITLPEFHSLEGPQAIIDGTIILKDDSTVRLKEVHPTIGSDVDLVRKEGNQSSAYAHIDRIDSRNVDSGSRCAVNANAGSVLILTCGQMWVGASNRGIADTASGFGHIHVKLNDLYLAGNNARGVNGNSNNSSIIGYIDHILETGSPTGTIGIFLGATSIVDLICVEINCDTAYDVTPGGSLSLVCPKVIGLRTGTLAEPEREITPAALAERFLMKLGNAALPTSAAGLAAGDLWNDTGTVKIV